MTRVAGAQLLGLSHYRTPQRIGFVQRCRQLETHIGTSALVDFGLGRPQQLLVQLRCRRIHAPGSEGHLGGLDEAKRRGEVRLCLSQGVFAQGDLREQSMT